MLKSGDKGAVLPGTLLLLPYPNHKTTQHQLEAVQFSQGEVGKVGPSPLHKKS